VALLIVLFFPPPTGLNAPYDILPTVKAPAAAESVTAFTLLLISFPI